MASKALPAHLRAPANDASNAGSFEGKHHGKSQSHMAFTSLITSFSLTHVVIKSWGPLSFDTLLTILNYPLPLPLPLFPLQLSHLKPPFRFRSMTSMASNGSGLTRLASHQAFENASTSVAASQMRNALNALADSVTDGSEKKRFEAEMDNFFALFRRFLNDKAKGNAVNWDRIAPPQPSQVVGYDELGADASVEFLNKLAVVKLNGGLGTSMGCVGPKSVIEVREGMSFLDLSVRQIEHLNRTFNVNVPFVLMNSFNTDQDTQSIIKKYEGHNVDIITFNQSRYPRIIKDSLLPAPKSFDAPLQDWYPPGHGDVFESLYNSGTLDKLIERGIEYIFLSNADNLGAVVDLRILQHMVDSNAEYIMELTDKTKADVKGGTIIDYDGKVRLLEIAQVPKEHVNEFKSIKKFKYFNTNNIWMNVRAIKRVVEENELEMEIIANEKSIPADKKGEADQAIYQLETAVGAAIRHFKNAHGINVPRRRFLPVKTCSDLMVVKSDLYRLEHGQLVMDPNRFGGVPVIKLGSDFKKVSDFQKRIASIPRIVELDHLTITGAVNLGRNVTLKGTVIIVATEGSTIDIPPGSVLENCVVQGSLRILEH
ncbi:UTP--glucose-1-phosphate uridylyltransferase [Penicillium macrosclerotiorum]|uniref:UTP--glucose-1-phosphate uridylyltransferase n=1 Tax=Penicillium macrosclerotiorum TaxID=303699 RepID=UPI00254783CF|nr:UTP--glucose-1-phosphate uridylyltransferase [Penicillium macrosclerotiorum]KAJ5698147.1 UTP--glucose-1-phosphate uridylyltransferase [Penicillium macrosclerotiorum]